MTKSDRLSGKYQRELKKNLIQVLSLGDRMTATRAKKKLNTQIFQYDKKKSTKTANRKRRKRREDIRALLSCHRNVRAWKRSEKKVFQLFCTV